MRAASISDQGLGAARNLRPDFINMIKGPSKRSSGQSWADPPAGTSAGAAVPRSGWPASRSAIVFWFYRNLLKLCIVPPTRNKETAE